MKLYSKANGRELKAGDKVTTIGGEEAEIIGFRPPARVLATGKVYITFTGHKPYSAECTPSAINAEYK